jgi:hypothetical protein
MRLLKVAFVMLIALDLLIILLAVFLVKPIWILLSIIGCVVSRGLYNHFRIRHKTSQYLKQKNRLRIKLGLAVRSQPEVYK